MVHGARDVDGGASLELEPVRPVEGEDRAHAADAAVERRPRLPRRDEGQRGDPLLPRREVGERVDGALRAQAHAPEQPRVVGGHVGVGHLLHRRAGGREQRAVVVDEGVVVGRVLRAHPREHRRVAPAERGVPPGALRAVAPEHLPGGGLRAGRPARLEEDRAADAQAIGLERRVAAIDLDAIDEPRGNAGEVGGAGHVVVQGDAREIDGDLRRGRASDGSGRRSPETPRLRDLHAHLPAQDLGHAKPRRRELLAVDDGARDGGILRGARGRPGVAVHFDRGRRRCVVVRAKRRSPRGRGGEPRGPER